VNRASYVKVTYEQAMAKLFSELTRFLDGALDEPTF
jgi:hypothetical protein